MKVSGFTFIRNALIFDYPIVEAIRSILPVCDEFIVAVGKSTDDTLGLIQKIHSPKIRIIETEWDESLKEGGQVLAVETNKAFAGIAEDSDWAFYIQGDEVIHEKYLDTIYQNMLLYKDVTKVDGLLFNYLHFYGSYDYIASSSAWYSNEIRIIRNDKSIYSYRDAQGFRKGNDEKLSVIPINAFVYHYGWVKEPKAMQKKQENFHSFWHDQEWIEKNVVKADEFDYGREVDELVLFKEDHPQVMLERIRIKNWKFDHDISRNKKSIKNRLKDLLRRYFGLDFSYKNYRVIK